MLFSLLAKLFKLDTEEAQLIRYAVHQDIIDARAARLRKPFVKERGWIRSVLEDEFVHAHVDEIGGVPCLLTSVSTDSNSSFTQYAGQPGRDLGFGNVYQG